MDADKYRAVEIFEKTYLIHKLPAKIGLKVKLILGAKVLPTLKGFMGLNALEALMLAGTATANGDIAEVIKELPLEQLSDALMSLEDSAFDKICNYILPHCYGKYDAGPAKVLNRDGSFGVTDVEYDEHLMLGLLAHSLKFNFEGFLAEGRLRSIFKGIMPEQPTQAEQI